MLGRYDRVILTDFGIARARADDLTDTGGSVGSPEFVAPERVLGQRPAPASNLGHWAVVLYAATERSRPSRRNNTPGHSAVGSSSPPTARRRP